MNRKDYAIGVLSVTAVILLTTVVLLSVLKPEPVHAFAQLDQGGGFTLYTSNVDGTLEYICIINQQAGLLNIYRYEINSSRLQPVQQIPLPPVQSPSVGQAAPGGAAAPGEAAGQGAAPAAPMAPRPGVPTRR